MSNTFAHAHLPIHCTLAQAKQIKAVLKALEAQLPHWLIAPTNPDTLTDNGIPGANDWPQWARHLLISLADYLMDNERDYLSYDIVLGLPIINGRPVDTEVGFQGLFLEGDQVEDDLFEAAHLILKALESEQLISTGTAYTGDRADEYTYAGNFVTITRHGWQFLLDNADVTACEVEAAQHCAYWLATYGPEGASTPNTLIWITTADDSEAQVAEQLIADADRVGLPDDMEASDLTLTRIPGTTFRHLDPVIPSHESEGFSRKPFAHTENAA